MHGYARQALAFLVDGPIDARTSTAAAGSGTVLKTADGHVVVLTAKHVIEEMPEGGICVGSTGIDGIADAVARRWMHPTEDVAVALLSSDAQERFVSSALPADVVPASSDTQFLEENPMLICGFPSAYRKTLVDRAADRACVEFFSTSYLTVVDPLLDERGRYRVTWKEAVLSEHDRVEPAVKPGEIFVIRHPRGISGGPLWRFRRPEKTALWAPAKMANLVGIASTYLDGIEFCPSVAVWGDWFRETLSSIDAASHGGK
jgi:hypothetical protein